MARHGVDFNVRLPREALDDLAHLARNAANLKAVASVVASRLPTLSPGTGLSRVSQLVEKEAGVRSQDAQRILNTIANLYRVMNRLSLKAQAFVEAISPSVESHLSRTSDSQLLAAWKESTHAVAELLGAITDEHPIAIQAKAEQLSLAHRNVLVDARLLTDVRPVFNSGGDRVIEALISHVLLLGFTEADEIRTLEISLDADDVARLKRLCERAETKAITLRKALGEAKWSSFVVGEKADSSQELECP
jgi:hypothetical protein